MEDITIFPYNIERHYDNELTIIGKYVKEEKSPSKIDLVELVRVPIETDIPLDIKALSKKINNLIAFS